MGRLRSLIMALALALTSLSNTALAQTLLVDGVPVDAQIQTGQMHCYQLQTTPGSTWSIRADDRSLRMNPALAIGRGTDCRSMQIDRANRDVSLFDKSSQIDFQSGGGAYLVRLTTELLSEGRYRLVATRDDSLSTEGLLTAGTRVPPFLNDTSGASASSTGSGPAASYPAGRIIRDCADLCPEMVVIPAGSFMMGSPAGEEGRGPDEGPRRSVALAAFALGKFEITFAEYDACVADGGCPHRAGDAGWGRGRRPVIDVNWNDAQLYADWLSVKTGQRYFLPSEAEWEYAARAGSDTPWNTGSAIISDDANFNGALGRTVPVGGYPPNAFGLFDMHGNVQEWTLDCDEVGYFGAPTNGAAAMSGQCANRILRGGDLTAPPERIRSAYRLRGIALETRGSNVGFRVARALE